METILLISVIGLMNITCLYIGAKIGQSVKHDVPLKIPSPVSMVKEYQDKKKDREEQHIMDINMQNIENYDVRGSMQKDFD